MKRINLTRITLLGGLLLLSFLGIGQTDSLLHLFHQNVQVKYSVLRFEDNALASVRYTQKDIVENLQYYLVDQNGNQVDPISTTNDWEEVLFENLALDMDYSIYTVFEGFEFLLGSFNTLDNSQESFDASENLFTALEHWYEIPQSERPEATHYILHEPQIAFFERLSYIQVFLDMPHLPNTILTGEIGRDIFEIWLEDGESTGDNGGPPPPPDFGDLDKEILNFKPLDPSKIDKCICQYTMSNDAMKDFETSTVGKDYFYGISNPSKKHFQLGAWGAQVNAETFEHVKTGFAGPAKSIEYILQGHKTDKTIHGNHGGLTSNVNTSIGTHFAGLKMRFFCDGLPKKILSRLLLVYNPDGEIPDFSFLNPTPAEECLCSKKVEICWRYDAEIFAEAKEKSCFGILLDNQAAMTVQDYVEVSLQQGSSAKEVLRVANTTLKAKCNANHIDEAVKVAELAAKNQELLAIQAKIDAENTKSNPDQTKLAALRAEHAVKLAEFLAKNGEQIVNDCSSDSGHNQLIDECRQITLNSNETTYFKMNTAHKINAQGHDCFQALANIKSDFYITAIMDQPNITVNDVKYCCSKKWGRYLLASFPGAPMSLQQARDEVGNKFAFAGTWDFPYHDLVNNPTVSADRDVLSGGQRCDDVIIQNLRLSNEGSNYFNEVEVNQFGLNSIQVEKIPNTSVAPATQIVVTDIMGRVIANDFHQQHSVILENLPLRNGVYFISLRAGTNVKTFKVLHIE